jgi:hypothetical protein
MDMKLELVAVPVTDVDRAKASGREPMGLQADGVPRVALQ